MAMELEERIAMHRRETRVLLRHYLEQGVSKTELAKVLLGWVRRI